MTVLGEKFRGIGIRLDNSVGLAIMLVLLGFAPAAAKEVEKTEGIVQLKKNLTAQEVLIQKQAALIQELLQRVEALEASQAKTREKVGAVLLGRESAEASREEAEETLVSIRKDLEETSLKLDHLPQLGGYYDFEYFDDDRSNNPGEFRQHHVTLLLFQEHEKVRWFSEIEFEFGTLYKGEGGTNLKTGSRRIEDRASLGRVRLFGSTNIARGPHPHTGLLECLALAQPDPLDPASAAGPQSLPREFYGRDGAWKQISGRPRADLQRLHQQR